MINIPLRVKNLIKKYNTNDPYRIAKELKIEIVFCETPNKINGMWRRILRRKYIVIDKNLNEWQRMAVIGHEIAHIKCHKGYMDFCIAGRTFFASKHREDEANNYAAELISYGYDINKEYIVNFLNGEYR